MPLAPAALPAAPALLPPIPPGELVPDGLAVLAVPAGLAPPAGLEACEDIPDVADAPLPEAPLLAEPPWPPPACPAPP